jgi:hypothetical protein
VAQYRNKLNCSIINEQRVRSRLNRTYWYWILDLCDWFTACKAAIEGELSSRFPPTLSPNVIYFVMKYEVTFDKGCSAINFMPVKGPKLHRCYVLQLQVESIASWCCTLISRQHRLFGAWRVAELTGDYRVRAHNPLEEEAIWRSDTGYLSSSLCTPLFYIFM